VDINRNFPIHGAAASAGASPVCHSSENAPVQPETDAIVGVIRDFQPHRILATHAISTASSAGIYADPNTHPGATALACSMAGQLRYSSDRPHNRLNTSTGQCDAVFPGDTRGALPSGRSLGRYASRTDPHQTTTHVRGIVPVITLEAPGYSALGTGTGARTVDEFLRPLRGFLGAATPAVASEDLRIIQDIQNFASPMRRLFLTGRLPSANAIHNRIRRRIQTQIGVLNGLRPRPPRRIHAISGRRAFDVPVRGSTPQAQIFFEKFTFTGSKRNGWDTLPNRYYVNKNRSLGVNRQVWLKERTGVRLREILRYSALPGTSRHHWGTDVDFNSTTNADWGANTGPGGRPGPLYPLSQWLQANAARAAFLQVYTPGRTGGHADEPWHFSYQPLAGPIRSLYNRDVQQTQDIVDPIVRDWTARAAAQSTPSHPITLPTDLRHELLHIDISQYVNTIGSEL
jgi:hypothetical protein